MGSNKSNLKLELLIKFYLGSFSSSLELELLLKRMLEIVWLSFEPELSPKSHLGSLFLSLELELFLTPNLGENLIESWARTFTRALLGKSLFKSKVGTFVKFCSRVFDRNPNCNSQKSLKCKFFEKVSGLNISQIQILNSFFHLFLTCTSSSRELTRVIGSFRSHLGQFLNHKPTRDVPSGPDWT